MLQYQANSAFACSLTHLIMIDVDLLFLLYSYLVAIVNPSAFHFLAPSPGNPLFADSLPGHLQQLVLRMLLSPIGLFHLS